VKKVLGSIAAGVLMFAAASACAQSTDLPVVYAGIALGGSKAEGFCAGVSGPGVTCDDTGAALKVFGGYQFHRHFAVELGIGGMGEWVARGPGGVVEMSTGLVEALGLAVLPIGESVAFYGKAGVYRASTEARANTIAVVGDFEESNTDFTAGFGVRIDITRKFGVRAEWQRYFDVGGGNIGVSDIDVFSVGVQLKF
jgi:OmpA-OmpF porin, OOP family